MLVQFLAAAVAGVALFYRTIKMKIRSIFGFKEKASDDLPEEGPQQKDGL